MGIDISKVNEKILEMNQLHLLVLTAILGLNTARTQHRKFARLLGLQEKQ